MTENFTKTQLELINFFSISPSIQSLDADTRKKLFERLMTISEEGLKKIIEVFENEQKYLKLKILVDDVQNASRDLDRAFRSNKEQASREKTEDEAERLLQKLK
ncbi:hypothetical protein GF340_06190 [Candidatus Peregrinibacteria bacterium]|nr:hypothetical protein [Candidatus Peregrinibacteria bacterium]